MRDTPPPFELAGPPEPVKPRLPGFVVLRRSQDDVIGALLADMLIHAGNCVRAFGDLHLALSLTPQVEPVVQRLLTDPLYRAFPWSRTRVWLVDEELPRAGERPALPRRALLHELVVEGSGIPLEQAHAIDVVRDDAPAQYESLLREHLGWREKGHDRLDFALLSLAASGAWLGPASEESEGLVARVPADQEQPARVAMTHRLLRAARCVALFASGRNLAPAIANRPRAMRLAGHHQPDVTEVRWYVDHAAAAPA